MTRQTVQHALVTLTALAALGLSACVVSGSSDQDEFTPTTGSGTPTDGNGEVTGDNGETVDPCTVSEEGMSNCGNEEDFPGDGSGPGGATGTNPGDGTSTNPGDGSSGGGDCPEEGCPDDGSGGGANGTNPGDGTSTNPGDGTSGGGDCPEEGCPDDGGGATGTDPGDGTTTNPGGGGTTTQPECFEEQFTPSSSAAADLMLVVDRSGSMDEIPPNASNTKWNQVRNVVTSVTAELDDSYGFGLMFFPAGATESLQCVGGNVVVDIDDNNAIPIAGAFLMTGPGGGTPTAATLHVARAHLRNRLTTRPQAVVLATDGAPNCNAANDINSCVCSQTTNCSHNFACLDDDETVSAVQNLASDGIATFVVGIPGSEVFAGVLDQMATAGGTAVNGVRKYYEANSQTALEDALRAIGQRVSQCRFELQNDAMGTSLAVSVNGSAVARDPSRVNGWDYVGARTIEFFGASCQALAGGTAQVAVEYCSVQDG